MAEGVFNPLRRVTLREQVLESLRERILDGSLPPGTRLAEVEVSDNLGVSRGTVREALRTLQQSGLVESDGAVGLQVRKLNAQQITELYEVRYALEGAAVERVLSAPDADARVDQLEDALPPNLPAGSLSRGRALALDLAFHERLLELSGNETLTTIWRQLKEVMVVAVLGDALNANEHLMKRDYHQPVVDAMRSGSVEVAQAVLREHMQMSSRKWAEAAG